MYQRRIRYRINFRPLGSESRYAINIRTEGSKSVTGLTRDPNSHKCIYIGSVTNANNLVELQNTKITTIISMANEFKTNKFSDKFIFKHFGLNDDLNEYILPTLINTIEFIKDQTLIHCAMGRSRSVSAAMAYLMYVRDMTSDQALKTIQKYRPIAQPNSNYLNQLQILDYLLRYLKLKNLTCFKLITEYFSFDRFFLPK